MKFLNTTLLTIVLIASFSYLTLAQLKGDGNVTTQKRDITYFDEIVAKGQFEMFLTQGKEFKVEVTIDSNLQMYVLTQVTKQRLYIEVPDNLRKIKELKVNITVDDLNSLVLIGAVDATSDSLRLKTADFFISGTSDLKTYIFSETLDFEVSDVANVTAYGQTDKFNLRVTDEALIDAKFLETNICNLKASGFSDISVNVQKEFNLRVTGVGNIYYYGNPEINNTINSGTTFIIRRKLE